MKTLRLTNSDKVALIDDEFYELCMQSNWMLLTPHTKSRSTKDYVKGWREGRNWLLHQFIWFKKYKQMSNHVLVIDHIDTDGKNDQCDNLRMLPSGGNSKRSVTAKGVYYHSHPSFHKNPWEANYFDMIDGKRVTLFGKYFATEQEAIDARQAYKREHNIL